MKIAIKKGASVFNLKPEMSVALMIACNVYHGYGYDLTLTEGTAGGHSRGSQHPLGYAIDLRTNNLGAGMAEKIAEDLRASFNEEFQVIVEKTHIHIEFDPKYKGITYLT